MTPLPLDIGRITRHTFVARVEQHPVLGSTNDRAKQCAAESTESLPLLILADRQEAGRGRGVNRWWTGRGSLACSLLVDAAALGIDPSRGPMMSLAAGLAVVDTAATLLSACSVGLHWPNDVFAARRKLAGILIEALPGGLAVIGIGLNTNNTIDEAPAELRPLVATLRDLTGSEHDPTSILVSLMRHLERKLRCLAMAPEQLAARANDACLQKGKTLHLELGDQIISGRCLGIASDGALLLETSDGARPFYSGVLRHDPQER